MTIAAAQRAEDYRAKAAETMALAGDDPLPNVLAQHQRAASHWTALAEREDRAVRDHDLRCAQTAAEQLAKAAPLAGAIPKRIRNRNRWSAGA